MSLVHPTSDYIARIIRREHEQHHTVEFKLIGEGIPDMGYTESVKVFGDFIEVHAVDGMNYFVPAHQIKYITHETTTSPSETKGWNLYI